MTLSCSDYLEKLNNQIWIYGFGPLKVFLDLGLSVGRMNDAPGSPTLGLEAACGSSSIDLAKIQIAVIPVHMCTVHAE